MQDADAQIEAVHDQMAGNDGDKRDQTREC